MKKILAFTLAETLIVMGIIGIVSALTLPNLNSSTGEKEKVAKVKKIYQNLNDAAGRAVAVYGKMDEWAMLDSSSDDKNKRRFERITEFMKLSKSNASNQTAILADGTLLEFSQMSSSDCAEDRMNYDNLQYCGEILVDIDGNNKGKNEYGIDRFYFNISADGIIVPNDGGFNTGSKACIESGDSMYCTRWVVENENMDYLKCNDKLKWGQQISCK